MFCGPRDLPSVAPVQVREFEVGAGWKTAARRDSRPPVIARRLQVAFERLAPREVCPFEVHCRLAGIRQIAGRTLPRVQQLSDMIRISRDGRSDCAKVRWRNRAKQRDPNDGGNASLIVPFLSGSPNGGIVAGIIAAASATVSSINCCETEASLHIT